jgi:putative ABC transport system ATP-binding protein
MIEFQEVRKSYVQGRREVVALDGVSLNVEPGEFLAVMGPSGSGKSTLLHLAAGFDRPTSGRVLFDGRPLHELSDDEMAELRRRKIGFIFQAFNLIPTLTVMENCALPLLLSGRRLRDIRPEVERLLGQVGLDSRIGHFPEELSGGEMQRVAVARALSIDPALILADEPTGNLDSVTGGQVLSLLRDLSARRTVVIVTHDPKAAAVAGRRVTLRDGRLQT